MGSALFHAEPIFFMRNALSNNDSLPLDVINLTKFCKAIDFVDFIAFLNDKLPLVLHVG